MLQRLSKWSQWGRPPGLRGSPWTRRSWLLGILSAPALQAQAWIRPFRQLSNGPASGLPSCPVCGVIGALPGTPIVVSNPDGSLGASLAKAVLFVCQQCGCLFAGFT